MRTSVILIVVCAALLLGAWGLSRALLTDVGPPPSSTSELQAAPRVEPRPAAAEPVFARPTPNLELRRDLPVAMPEPARRDLAPAPVVVVAPPAPVGAGDAEPDEAPDPYLGASAELDYAENLVADPSANRERLHSARDAFTRCLELHPTHERCIAGLTVANNRLRLSNPQKLMKNELKPAKPLHREQLFR